MKTTSILSLVFCASLLVATSQTATAEWSEEARLIEQSLTSADRVVTSSRANGDGNVTNSPGTGQVQVRVALIGDSTCATWGASSNLRGWGEFVPFVFKPGVQVQNFAVGGISTRTFISEGRLSQVLNYYPHYVLIDLGINDSSTSSPGYASPSQYGANLTYMVNQIKARGGQVLFVNPHTLNVRKAGAYGDDGLLNYRNSMSGVATHLKRPLIDLYARTKAYYNQIGPTGVKNHFTDTVHFTQTGALYAATFIGQEVRKSASPLKSWIK